jgi:transposase
MTRREKEIIRHLSVEELDRFLAETDDEKESKRLTFLKRVYKGASLADAADDVGKSGSTGSRWAKRWNEGGLGLLTPNFGDGRPPKLDELEQQQLIERLPEGEPWKKQEIQQMLIDEYDEIDDHLAINHDEHYVVSDAHTNSCENRHSFLRNWLRRFRGVSKYHLQGYLNFLVSHSTLIAGSRRS